MYFAVICRDRPDQLQLRLDTRPTHLQHLEGLNAKGTLKLAGPFLDSDGKPNGSLLVFEADTIDEARAIAESDPYAKAGLFESIEVTPWNWVFNAPEKA